MKKVLLLLVLLQSIVWAGTTGKIAGRVTDASTHQPLPSVNVHIVGTSLGTVTDADGNYFIINVPVGTYSVRASIIGYAHTTVEDVRVVIDQTTIVDFALENSDVRMSDVVVTAERRTIQQDRTSTKHTIDAETIVALPVDNFIDIVQQQAGVVGSHFRGGRFNESLFLVDGIAVKNPVNGYNVDIGGFSADIPQLSVSEIQVSTGGFDAEYGNAQSGIVNTITRTADRLGIRLRARTSEIPGQTMSWKPYAYGTGLPDWRDLEAFIATPAFNLGGFRIGVSASAENVRQTKDFLPHQAFYKESYEGKISATSDNNRFVFTALRSWGWNQSYNDERAYYGPLNMGYQQDWYQTLSVNSSTKDTSIIQYYYVADPRLFRNASHDSLGVYRANGRTYPINRVIYQTGMLEDQTLPVSQTWNGGLTWTLTLNQHSFLDVKVSEFWNRYHQVVRDVNDRNGNGNVDEDLQWWLNGTPSGGYTNNQFGALQYFIFTGDQGLYYQQETSTSALRVDYSNQFNSSNLLKGGVEVSYNKGDVTWVSFESVVTQRFDVWDEDLVDFACYLQDKIEVRDGFIVNAGLRLDYYNPNGLTGNVLFPTDITTLGNYQGGVGLTAADKVDAHWQLSPRIGIAHPITDHDKIHFYYGHFFQRPDMRYLYENVNLDFRFTTNVNVGNPRLLPEKTVSYELGWEHMFSDLLRLNVTGYYKDITNLVSQESYYIPGSAKMYQAYVNMDYANVHGLEFQIEAMEGSWYGGMINYTWAWANGRSSSVYRSNGEIVPRRLDPLDWDVRHNINANLLLRSAGVVKDIIGDANLDFVVNCHSGLPFSTYTRGFPLLTPRNDGRLPWSKNVDVRFRKPFRVSNIEISFLAEARNLFNWRNVQYISGGTEGILEYLATGNPSGPYNNPQSFSPPRTYRLVVEIQY